ncbi:MAG: 3'-5' exonuclease [Planctomycetota bacterium]
MLENTDFENILKDTDKDNAKRFLDLIKEDKKKEVNKMLTTLRAVRDKKQMEDKTKDEDKTEDEDKDKTDLAELLKKIGIDAYGMARDYLKDEIKFYKPTRTSRKMPIPLSNPGIGKIPITITTIEGSKGLDADYVFITYFDNQYFVKNRDKSKVSDQDICNFLVALTRARRRVFLISSNTNKKPIFLKWIDKKRITDKSAPDPQHCVVGGLH